MNWTARWFVVTAAIVSLHTAARAEEVAASRPEEASLRTWADDLDADSYGARETAARELIRAGAAAVPFVRRAGESKSLEAIARAVHILSRIASAADDDGRRQAEEALRELAASSDRRVADRASEEIRQRQVRRVAQLELLGARVYWESGTITRIYFSGSIVKDEDLSLLRHFPDVISLSLGGTNIGDAGMRHVTCLKKLERLDLFQSQVGDEGLKQIATMRSLKSLPMGRTKVTDAGLAHLRPMTQLEYLGLRGDNITDKGLVHLKPLKNLTGLYLGETKVTDAGLPHLAHLEQMEYLRLHTLRVSDAGLPHLRGMKNLTRIDVYDTDISDAGVNQLKAWLPDCNVVTQK
jgi:hypothetical protein